MKHILIILFIVSGWAASAQVKFTQMERDTVKWTIPVAHRSIPGITGYVMKYLSYSDLLDSLGVTADSIYISGDTIFLRDGSGFVKLAAGWGLDVATSGSTVTYKADTSKLATLTDIGGFFTLPTFTAGSVIFSNGSNLAQDNANLFWDDTNNRLGIGTTIPQAAIETRAGIGIGAYVVGDGLTVDGSVASGGYPFRIQNFNPSVDGASYADFTGTPTAPNYVNGLSFTVSGYSGNFQSLFKNSVGLSSLSIESGIADTYLNFNQNVGSNSWSMGLDYSDSGKFKILKYYMPSTSGNGIIIDDNKVGINQHNPAYTLDVTGDVRVTNRSGTPQYGAAWDSSGKIVSTGATAGTVTSVATNNGITGGTITSSGTIGLTGVPLAIHNISSNGFISRTSSSTAEARTITAGNGTGIINGNGVSGNPTITSNFGTVYPYGTYTNFNTASDFGWGFVLGTTNAPNATSSSWYRGKFGLGEYSDYFMELAIPRFNQSTAGYWTRTSEGGSYSAWNQIGAGTVTGTGTATRVAFWSGTSSLSSDADLYWDNTNKRIGLGTIIPTRKLSVLIPDGDIIAGFGGNGVQDLFTIGFARSAYTSYETTLEGSIYGLFALRSGTNQNISLLPNGTGKVGIGNTSPSYNLDVTGDIRLTDRTGTPQYNAAFDTNGKLVTTGVAPTSGTVTSIATTSPITGGTITSTGTIGINNAAADGTTMGASAYTAADFNSSSGLISLDYTNGQAASGSTKGFLSSTDWTTFNNKGNGTVTSVGLTAGSGINISGTNPITTSGTMTISGTRLYPWDSGLWVSGDLYLRTNNTGTYPTITYSGGTIYYNLPSASSGQVLKYNGTGWAAGTDNTGTGVTSVTASSPLFSSGGATPNITIQSASGSQNGSLTSSDWTAFNNKMDAFYVAASGTAGVGVVGPLDQLTITAGTGISATRSLRNITVSSTVTNTDNQTLSWSSPNLSISGGNSVALPVLPSGSVNQTLRHDGSNWVASSLLKTGSSNFVDINSWPGTVISGSKLLVNGYLQYTASGYSATSLSGQDTYGGLTGVTVGSGLSLSSGTLSSTATGTVTSIATNNGITGGTITSSGTIGLTGQALAVHNLGSNGLIARTSSGNVSARTITAGSGISVSNGDGVSGNPTISTNQSVNYGAIYNSSFYSESWTTGTPKKITMSSTSASSGVSISSSVLTTSSSGDYEISYSVGLQHTSYADWYCACYNSSGSSSYGQTWTTSRRDGTSLRSTLSMSTIVPLSSGDTISLWCYPDTGSGNDSVFYPKLSIKKIN